MNSRVDNLVRRRAEDEDEMMLFILPAVYLLSSNGGMKKRPSHTSRLSGKMKLKEIRDILSTTVLHFTWSQLNLERSRTFSKESTCYVTRGV